VRVRACVCVRVCVCACVDLCAHVSEHVSASDVCTVYTHLCFVLPLLISGRAH